MNKFKAIAVSAVCVVGAAVSQAAISFTGVAFSNAPGISVGDVGILIFDNKGLGFDSLDFTVGASITDSLTYGSAGDYTIALATSKTATSPVANLVTLSGAFANVPISNGVDVGDKFAFIVFETSTSTLVAGDKYTIWTDTTWVVKPDGNYSYNANPNASQYKQFTATSAPVLTGTVIPEPSSFAALAGLSILGAVATRRRRSA